MLVSLRFVSIRLAVLVTTIALAGSVTSVSGLAAKPVIFPYHLEFHEAVAVCYPGSDGEFDIISDFVIDGRAIVFAGTADNPLKAQFHNTGLGTLTNSVTGASLPDRSHTVDFLDVEAGTLRFIGMQYSTVVPGEGLLVADIGVVVLELTSEGQVVVAAHGPHPVSAGPGPTVFCPYLA